MVSNKVKGALWCFIGWWGVEFISLWKGYSLKHMWYLKFKGF